MFSAAERAFVEAARVGRLATADTAARPHVVPICFALSNGRIVTPIDEKPKSTGPADLQRMRDVDENPAVALVVDHYTEDWAALGWVQVRGTATVLDSDPRNDERTTEKGSEDEHALAVRALETKYAQYATHALAERPIIAIDPTRVLSWGTLE